MAAIAGSALLLGISSALQTTDDTLRQTIAQGMAQQLLDEILGCRYMEPGANPYAPYLGPESGESATNRYTFDDIDDYNGLRCQPPTDPFGVPLGTDDGAGGQRPEAFWCRADFFNNWRAEVNVYYVSEANPVNPLPSGQTSDYRLVEVRIVYVAATRGPRELVKLRQVVCYVPPLQVQ